MTYFFHSFKSYYVFFSVYILVSAALTLLVPYSDINPNAALPDAFSEANLQWVSYIIIIGAVCGMTTSLLGSLFSLPRCLYAMAEDGLIFKFFASVNNKTQVGIWSRIFQVQFSSIILFLSFFLVTHSKYGSFYIDHRPDCICFRIREVSRNHEYWYVTSLHHC